MTTSTIAIVGPTVDHATYVGASDIAALVGLSPYQTPLDVWARKTGRAAFAGNARTRAGSHFERAILDLYVSEQGGEEFGLGVGPLRFPGSLLDRERRGTGATPDAIDAHGRVTQVKLVGFGQAHRWGDPELESDGVPPEVLAQVHYEAWHAREVLGVESTTARAVAQLGTEQRIYTIALDSEFAEALIEEGRRFWRDHVLADRMPTADGASLETIRAVFPRSNKRLGVMSDDVLETARAYAAARDAESEAARRKAQHAAELCVAVGELEGLARGFGKQASRVTWSAQKGRIDWEACARALGATDALGEQYRGEPTRVLRVSIKEDR